MIIKAGNREFEIDDADFEKIRQHKWYVNEKGYVATWHGDKSKPNISLHRFLLDYDGPDTIDHIDRNPSNNKKENLRVVPQWKNNLNTRIHSTNTTGVRGVTLTRTGKWSAQIVIDNNKRHLGTFNTIEEATEARNTFESKMLEDETLRIRPIGRANNRSGFVGVSYNARTNRWKAKIDQTHLGYFRTKEEAVEARQKAEQNKIGTL